MIELVRRLDRARWTVHVACFHARGAWLDRAAAAAASVVPFPVRSFRRLETLRHMSAFAAWCQRQRIAVVHASELYSNIFALPAAARAGVPVRIGNRREINPNKSQLQIALQRGAYACATHIVANSEAAAQRLGRERVPARKISVVPNGIVLERYRPQEARRTRRTVAMVANLRTEKGHDVLMDAATIVLRRVPDARFLVIGDGAERDRLEQRARALDLGPALQFLGHQEDIPALLHALDIFVLPSRSEAFPNALLEAMATGMPVVASAVGGIPELVSDGANGLLVRPERPSELAASIERLMDDGDLANRLGAAARETVERRYSFEKMVDGFERVYLAELTRCGLSASRALELAAS
jgi:glycosyltransferase involved in cell wall biosynthesis